MNGCLGSATSGLHPTIYWRTATRAAPCSVAIQQPIENTMPYVGCNIDFIQGAVAVRLCGGLTITVNQGSVSVGKNADAPTSVP